MEQLRISFESALKQKLSQKSSSLQSEENVLARYFKFFDSNSDGSVSQNEWFKAIEKIGVIVPSLEDLKQLFKYYDSDHDGSISAKEFTDQIYRPDKIPAKSEKKAEKKADEKSELAKVEQLICKIRSQLAARGARGIIGLGRAFRIADNNSSKTLEIAEFAQCIQEMGLEVNSKEIELLFSSFDVDNSGTIAYEEFLRIIRGKMPECRKEIIDKVFEIFDKDHSGIIEVKDVMGLYCAKQHPDVISGKASEEEVMKEFLETFEFNVEGKDGKVTLKEFEDYYANVSAGIDDDQYFLLMMKSAWKLEDFGKPVEKAWKGYEEVKAGPIASPPKLSSPVKRSNKANISSPENTLTLLGKGKARSSKAPEPASIKSPTKENALAPILEKFRKKIAARGTRGMLGLAKQFRIMDDENQRCLDIKEWMKALRDYRVDIDPESCKTIFEFIDKEKTGKINYDVFMRAMQGELSPNRLKLVEQAFAKFDRESSGIADANEVKSAFSAKNHPDVKSGRKSEDEVLGDFLETFELHKNLCGGASDPNIRKDEFIDYYIIVSACISDDKYFGDMMNTCWKLYSSDTKRNAHEAELSAEKKHPAYSVAESAPYGTSPMPTEYSTALRPKKPASVKGEIQTPTAAAAGMPTYKKAEAVPELPAAPVIQNGIAIWNNLRKCLAQRGVRGLIGLQRLFKIFDSDKSGKVSFEEFKKILKDYRVKISESDIVKLFAQVDANKSGLISYGEFLRNAAGEMKENRKKIVYLAFEHLDKAHCGEVALDEIKSLYDASKHPDVKSGKRTEEDILAEFLDSFEQQYYYAKGGKMAGKVKIEEFLDYYVNINIAIEDDKIFEEILRGTWGLDG